jgi:hypothetical protein
LLAARATALPLASFFGVQKINIFKGFERFFDPGAGGEFILTGALQAGK